MERIPGMEEYSSNAFDILIFTYRCYSIQRRSKKEWLRFGPNSPFIIKQSLLAVKDEAKAELSRGTGPAKKRDLCVLKRNSDARK